MYSDKLCSLFAILSLLFLGTHDAVAGICHSQSTLESVSFDLHEVRESLPPACAGCEYVFSYELTVLAHEAPPSCCSEVHIASFENALSGFTTYVLGSESVRLTKMLTHTSSFDLISRGISWTEVRSALILALSFDDFALIRAIVEKMRAQQKSFGSPLSVEQAFSNPEKKLYGIDWVFEGACGCLFMPSIFVFSKKDCCCGLLLQAYAPDQSVYTEVKARLNARSDHK